MRLPRDLVVKSILKINGSMNKNKAAPLNLDFGFECWIDPPEAEKPNT
jgi:hypothetical protein